MNEENDDLEDHANIGVDLTAWEPTAPAPGFAERLGRVPTAPVAAAGLISGFGVAVATGSRPLGGVVLAALGASRNPAVVSIHSPRAEEPEAAAMREKFPTAALAIFDLRDGGWSRLNPESVALRRFATPKMGD